MKCFLVEKTVMHKTDRPNQCLHLTHAFLTPDSPKNTNMPIFDFSFLSC